MAGREFDEDVLRTVLDRRSVLAALAEEPHHRRELEAELDLSKTTCHRIVRSFDEKGLLRRTDRGYELTELGAFVEAQADRFSANVRAGYRLEPLVRAFESAEVDFDVQAFADATITDAHPDNPSPPLERSLELLRETDSIRVIEGAEFVPQLYVEKAFEIGAETEMTGEFIATRSIVESRVSAVPEYHRTIPEVDAGVRYLIHDDLPFGMTLYDDHVALRAYDEVTGSAVLVVDTDDPDAYAWAEEVYALYREQAAPLSEIDALPDWLPDPEDEF